jgi:hypothetical protein
MDVDDPSQNDDALPEGLASFTFAPGVPVRLDRARRRLVGRADCPGCTFAFTLALSNGIRTGGTCEHAGLQSTGTATIGYAPSFSYDYNGHSYAWTDVAVTYEPDAHRWYPFADATFVGSQFLSEARFAQTYSY